jgi:hypothetical protein
LDWKGREHEAAEPRVPAEPEEDSEGTVDEAGAPVADDAMLVGKNKVANAGFEIDPERARGADDPWKCWSSYHFAKFMAPHEYDDQVAHSGGRSLKIEEANWANEATRDGWIEQEVPGVGTGKTLTLSAWVKASKDPTRVRLCIYGWDPEWGRDFEAGVSPKFDIGTEWQRISWTRSFGANITKVHVMVKREHQVLGGDVWIDDVQLEEGTEATDWVPDAWSETMDR